MLKERKKNKTKKQSNTYTIICKLEKIELKLYILKNYIRPVISVDIYSWVLREKCVPDGPICMKFSSFTVFVCNHLLMAIDILN